MVSQLLKSALNKSYKSPYFFGKKNRQNKLTDQNYNKILTNITSRHHDIDQSGFFGNIIQFKKRRNVKIYSA